MIVLCFNMEEGDIINILMTSVICLCYNMQEEDVLGHTNAKCH